MNRCEIIQGDVLKFAESYSGEPFHALLCDPPYHLQSIVKRFGKPGSAPVKIKPFPGQGGSPYARGAKGFMGKEWDGGDIAFRPETWHALASLLYPGAFVMAFAGTRGYHRMAVAMEDAGLVIHPAIGWLFGSGFPKATRIKGDPVWSGHRYGLQAMKPAFEFIAVAQRPYEGKPVDCITKTGAGALNVDAGRIPGEAWAFGTRTDIRGGGYGTRRPADGDVLERNVKGGENGRWPANLAMDEVGAAVLDQQSGISGPSGKASGPTLGKLGTQGRYGTATGENMGEPAFYGDEGSASRYYLNTDWTPELAESDPVLYAAKAGTSERNAGLDGFRLQAAAKLDGGEFVNPQRGTVSTETLLRNPHPTVKPIRLTRWLASLLLPPAGYQRRILIPFCGSGSEAIGALLAGWDEVVGIELESEYAEIARARCRFWQGNSGLFEALTAESEKEPEQPELAI